MNMIQAGLNRSDWKRSRGLRYIGITFVMAMLLALASTASWALATTVNINTADAEALTTMLKGIGPKKAADIVKYREDNGPFKSVEDLVLVKGIGWRTLEQNRDRIILDDKEPALASQKMQQNESDQGAANKP